MIRIIAIGVGLMMAANGIFMFVQPATWYAAIPGVPDTGPLNDHFVRDIGLAYLVAGGALVWSEFGGTWRASLLGCLFIALHSALHVGETLEGHHRDVIVNELLAVHLPAVLSIFVAFAQRAGARREVLS